MDRRTVIAVVLSLGIYYAWLGLRGKPQPADEPLVPDVVEEPTPVAPAPVAPPTEVASDVPLQTVDFVACGTVGKLSNDGGYLHDLTLPDELGPFHVTPIYTWLLGKVTGQSEGPWQPYGGDPGPAVLLHERAMALRSGVGDGPTETPTRMQLTQAGPGDVTLVGQRAGIRIEQRIREHVDGEACTIDVVTTWTNTSGQTWSGDVWTAVLDHVAAKSGGRYASQFQPTALVDDTLKYGGALGAGCVRASTKLTDDERRIELEGPVSWYGISDRYFGFYVLPDQADRGELRFERVGEGDDAIDGPVQSKQVALSGGESLVWSSRVFAGENHLAQLAAVDPTLERVVDLGWFAFFGKPLVWVLHLFHGWTGSWGTSIILLTLLIKLAFFPMTHSAMKAAQKMQEIQPELNRIREQYADNPTEMNRLVMEVMSTHQANPVAGCLPMLVQMPVFFALYQSLLTNVEFYQEGFLYLKDLSSPDPYIVLPLAVMLLMWGQQRLSTPPANMEPAQQAVLKVMPLMFGLFFFTSPSGLGVYMLVNMSLSILQQWIIRRSIGGASAPAPAVPF
ncbi:MAG: membrane protein insertase YidC [Alphaproteobacteria bacterium]|nr:membrane protein insertase YidC [Alphaproteobacteria bacterium]